MPTPAARRRGTPTVPTTSEPGDETVVEADDAVPGGGQTMTYPSTGTIDFPDGRHVRITQADVSARPEFFVTDPGEEEREVRDDELHDLIEAAHQLQAEATP